MNIYEYATNQNNKVDSRRGGDNQFLYGIDTSTPRSKGRPRSEKLVKKRIFYAASRVGMPKLTN